MSTINGGVCVVNGKPVDKVYSNGIQVYGRNLAHGIASSKDWFVFQGFNNIYNYGCDLVNYSLDTFKAGDIVTFGITIKNNGVTNGRMVIQQHGNVSYWSRDAGRISPITALS